MFTVSFVRRKISTNSVQWLQVGSILKHASTCLKVWTARNSFVVRVTTTVGNDDQMAYALYIEIL